MTSAVRELIGARDLVRALVYRDMKVRYRGSLWGFVWSLAVPAVQVLAIALVVKLANMVRIPNYAAVLFCGLLPWMFLVFGCLESCGVIPKHRELVKKIYFPRQVLPVSVVIGNLIHFVFTVAILLAWLRVNGHCLEWTYILLPVIVLAQSVLVAGMALLSSALGAFYVDVEYVFGVVFSVGIWFSPIYWVPDMVQERFPHLVPYAYLNPMAGIVGVYRSAILHTDFAWPPAWAIGYSIAFCLLMFVVGQWVFGRLQWRFPEVI